MPAKKKTVKKKRGRPKFIIDYVASEKLATIHCTQNEIASYLGCSVDTLQRDAEFCGLYKKGLAHGAMSLRRLQWKSAEAGNVTILIWLGKQLLNQRDEPIVTNNTPGASKLVVNLYKSGKKVSKKTKGNK